VAILDHPSNLRHPTGWHARGYSLNAANPFALGSFSKDKKKDGSYTLPAGQQLRLRYLVVVHEGELTSGRMEQYFSTFASK
jgi:Methane oxygenase PmoA